MDPVTLNQPATSELSRITALVTLLADEDPKVGQSIADHLRDVGTAALPALRAAVSGDHPLAADRARALVREMAQEEVIEELTRFTHDGCPSLEDGLFILARLHSPDLDQDALATRLSHMAEDLMIRLDPGDGVDIMLTEMSRYLHEEIGFSGNTQDYYNLENSYLHTVVANRLGIPISLSCIYLVLAKRLGLPVYGTGMPGHFLIKYDDGHDTRIIDPFHRGRRLDRDGCAKLLRGLGLAYDDRYLAPVDNRYVLERSLKNLVAIFSDRQMAVELALHQRALTLLQATG